MRAKIILFLSLLIPFTLAFIYLWATGTNYIQGDEFLGIKGGVVESYINGTLTFSDLWRPFTCIRALGNSILCLANIKLFSMNSKILILMIPFLLLSSAILIYYNYKKSLASKLLPEFIAATFFILTLIIFNVTQWQTIANRMSFYIQLPMPFIIASFISLERYLTKGRQYWPPAFIITTLAVLVFGGTLIFAFPPSLGVTLLCYVLTQRTILKKDFYLRTLITGVFLSVIIFIYAFRITHNDYAPPLTLYFVTDILDRPLEALQFLLSSFGASIVGIDTFFTYDFFSHQSIIIMGLVLVLFYAFALILFFRSSMYKKTYLPFFLIMQTFFYLSLMTISRFGLGDIAMGMSSRYTSVSLFGLVGIAWIFIFVLAQPTKMNPLFKSIIYAGFAIIFSGLLLTSIDTWNNKEKRKTESKKLYDIAMRVDTASDDELWKFEADPKQVRDSLRLLRQHKLNIYNNVPAENK